jgi:hypothetical protein
MAGNERARWLRTDAVPQAAGAPARAGPGYTGIV